jgi:hypothetical protein
LKLGLTVTPSDGVAGMKSSDFGVFNRGDDGHLSGNGNSEQE